MNNEGKMKTGLRSTCVGLAMSLLSMGCLGVHSLTPTEVYNPALHSDHQIELLSVDDSVELYQIMKDLHEVFTQCRVPYWVDFGSGLGAIRNNGIIPWDDDLDVGLLVQDEPKLLVLGDLLGQYGYSIQKAFFGYRIVKDEGDKAVFDIFLMKERDGKFYYVGGDWGNRDGGDLYITPSELFPLKLVNFGPIQVMAPNDAAPFMSAVFRGWKDVAYSYGHQGQRKFKIDLNEHSYFKRPAPLNPETFETIDIRNRLQDRIPEYLDCPRVNYDQRLPFPDFREAF